MYLYIGGELRGLFEGKEHIREVLTDGDISNFMEELTTCKGIIILADTEDVHATYLTYTELPVGIYIVQQLRLKGIKAPILFTSYASRAELYNHKPDREILMTVGHDFIQRPVRDADLFIELLAEMKPLDDLELFDIQHSCCRKEDTIRQITHKLNNIKYFTKSQFQESTDKKEILIHTIHEIASLYQADTSYILDKFEYNYPTVDEQNISSAIAEVTAYGEWLIYEHTLTNAAPNNAGGLIKGWKLLWVDDEADEQHELIRMFMYEGVEVILTQSSATAWEILEQDWENGNAIGIVLADYRLYENREGVRVQQPIQGYGLLSKIAGSGRMVRLAALSALPRKFLLHSFRHFSIRTEIFSKKDYLEDKNTTRLFCDELLKMGDEHWEAILSQPNDASGWEFLRPGYKLYRNAWDYTAMERRISEKASFFIEYYEQHQKFPDTVPFNKSNFNLDRDPRKTLEKFQYYWLGRRLALWLGAVKQLTPVAIRAMLTGEPAGTSSAEKKKAENAAKNIISQVLGLRLNSFPLGLTVEEKNWFHYSAGIPVYRQIIIARNLLQKIEDYLERLVAEHQSFLKKLSRNDYVVSIQEKKSNNRSSIIFDTNGKPALKTLEQVKILYRILMLELALNETDILSVARTLKGLVEQEICRHKPREITRAVKLLRDYFQRKVAQYAVETNAGFSEAELSVIRQCYEAVIQGTVFRPKRADDRQMELYTMVLLAWRYKDYEQEIIRDETTPVTIQEIIAGVRQQKLLEKRYKKESDDLTVNNVGQNGRDVVDYLYEYEDAYG